jgi:hypothetical protein
VKTSLGFAHLESGNQVVVVGAHHGGVLEASDMLAVCSTFSAI